MFTLQHIFFWFLASLTQQILSASTAGPNNPGVENRDTKSISKGTDVGGPTYSGDSSVAYIPHQSYPYMSDSYPNSGYAENYLVASAPLGHYSNQRDYVNSVLPLGAQIIKSVGKIIVLILLGVILFAFEGAIFIATALYTALRIFAKIGLFLVGGVALLVVGGIFTTAVCSLTPLCTITFMSFRDLNKETMRSYMNPEAISAAADFVNDAIGKYQRIQRAITD